MTFDLEKFVVGELARLVEHNIGNHHLADIVQQASQTGIARFGFAQAQLSRQRNHQRTYRHRMHVGVFVLVLEARQTDDGAGVARDRTGYFFHQRQRVCSIQRLAHARLMEHRGDCFF